MPAICHVHTRFIDAPEAVVRPLLGELWSGGPRDAFPHEHIRRWRALPEGASAMCEGTTFGHGPFAFAVSRCDARGWRADITTKGFFGHHGFALESERGGTRVVHELRAVAELREWLVWSAVVGVGHDWAVRTCLARLAHLARARGDATDAPGSLLERVGAPPPLQLRAFAWGVRATVRASRALRGART